ncbi:phosphoribosyltransferase [Calothrix sp. NIES-4101]|nr:phosphoribosyltransferase [Calothrix sp. NIES-4101]
MTDAPFFLNRTQAGERLAEIIQANLRQQLIESGVEPIPIVYALPRGGLPVAAPIADLLQCPLTVLVAKKISHPNNPELAIGAVTASGLVLWANEKLLNFRGNSRQRQVAMEIAINKAKSLESQFLPFCPQVNPQGATLILVDDGIATGMTIAVAAKALNLLAPAQIFICSPVAPPQLLPWLQDWCDNSGDNCDRNQQKLIRKQNRIIVLETPEPFLSVSNFYVEFPQIETSEALTYLQQRNQK